MKVDVRTTFEVDVVCMNTHIYAYTYTCTHVSAKMDMCVREDGYVCMYIYNANLRTRSQVGVAHIHTKNTYTLTQVRVKLDGRTTSQIGVV